MDWYDMLLCMDPEFCECCSCDGGGACGDGDACCGIGGCAGWGDGLKCDRDGWWGLIGDCWG